MKIKTNDMCHQQQLEAHGGTLCERYLSSEEALPYQKHLHLMPSWDLTARQLCDLELLLNGGFSPLTGFMTRDDYAGVLRNMRLANGILWPIPVTLDVTPTFADTLELGNKIVLRDPEGVAIAILQVSDIWTPNKIDEAEHIYGTNDIAHPAVNYLFNNANEVYLGGVVYGIKPPIHYDFRPLRHAPRELRDIFTYLGWPKIIAFQTRNPIHKAHLELTLRGMKEHKANLLIHPSVGMTKPGDIDHYTRVRCYEKILPYYPDQTVLLSLLPLAMRMGGPKEALWHAIIRKNYGCTHFIVGRDHAGPGKNSKGQDCYEPYAAQALVSQYQQELNIRMIPFQELAYVRSTGQYHPVNEIKDKQNIINISGTDLRRYLQEGIDIPEWFSFPEIVEELRKTYPPKHEQGFTIFFTGLSSSGKSTLANALMVKLMELQGRPITLLDGDIVRKNLSSELGFSKDHRNLNILRIGYVANEITKHRGVAICAAISPYQATRQKVREMISLVGGFIEVYISTPLEVCEKRDRKGLYAKARTGQLPEFTGISDPYEVPENPEVIINNQMLTVDESLQLIFNKLKEMNYL